MIIYNLKTVGCISCRMMEDSIYEDGCLCVIPEFHGRGLGTSAMEFIKKIL